MTAMTILAWLNDADIYRDSIVEAGLDDTVEFIACAEGDVPDASVLATTEVFLAWWAPEGVLAKMPRLRWIQALTATTDNWLRREIYWRMCN
ncbi:MAG: hypothetical protein AAGA73_09300 [Pseudomonadota bacterium]